MPRDPTRAQLRFAAVISKKLGVAMPDILTRQTLFVYIKNYRPEFDRRRSKTIAGTKTQYTQGATP